jgi:general stress protein 26
MGSLENLSSTEAIEKLSDMASSIRVCMFTTGQSENGSHTRPMSTQEVDEQGNIWFFSGKNSHKNAEIKAHDITELYYAHPGDEKYLYVKGKSEIYTDKNKIEELWNPIIKAWFEKGKDDPNLTVIKVIPHQAYYWDNKHGKMIQFLSILASTVTGKGHDDSVEGKLRI